jgi:hypothetical protein
MSKYALWCSCASSLTEPSWVLDNEGEVVTYKSEAEAKRDLKKNFVSTSYEIRRYSNVGRPRTRPK